MRVEGLGCGVYSDNSTKRPETFRLTAWFRVETLEFRV